MALLTVSKEMALIVSKETALTEAGNSVLTTSNVFHGLAGNYGMCACKLNITKHSTLTQLVQTRHLQISDGW